MPYRPHLGAANGQAPFKPYPLQWQFPLIGLGVGLFWSLTTVRLDGLSIFAFVVLFTIYGVLWIRDDPPILAFCLGVQWVSVSSGYLFYQVAGFFPGRAVPGNLPGALLLALLGLLCLAIGIRMALRIVRDPLIRLRAREEALSPRYEVRALFWCVIALFTVNWVMDIFPRVIFFNAAEFIGSLLEFRNVFLCLLFLVILKQGRGYHLGLIAFLYAAVPLLGNKHVKVFEVFFLLIVALLAEWRPWWRSTLAFWRNLRIGLGAVVTVFAVLVMAAFWQERVKATWRDMLDTGVVSGSPLERVQVFTRVVKTAAEQWDAPSQSTQLLPGESFAQRAAGIYYFTHVLDRVPSVTAHENGALALRAFVHTVKPRILFPEKPILPSSSWLIRKYTGQRAAAEESNTSIGMSYMAEFYIDFGPVGMLIALVLGGALVGMCYAGVQLVSPSCAFARAAVIPLFLDPFASFEGETTYLLGGLMNRWLVFMVLMWLFGATFHRWLQEPRVAARLPHVAPQTLDRTTAPALRT